MQFGESARFIAMASLQRDIVFTRSEVIKEGWLLKQSKFLKEWRRRWCILTPKYFLSFKGPNFTQMAPTEVIPLHNCWSVKSADDDINKEHSFRLETSERIVFLVAENTLEKESWIGYIGRQMVRPSVVSTE